MTLTELVKKVRASASRQLSSLRTLVSGRGFRKFKKIYAIDEQIGLGGFGIVYAAHSLATAQSVAVKFVERRHVTEWGILNDERLPMEVCMLARCRNIEGVISLIDHYTVPDGYLIVQERPLISIDLYGFISENRYLSEELTIFLFRQIVDAVCECFKRKVLHRDIKNENIVIDLLTGTTKLIDFGAATLYKASHCSGFQGTRLYCPPEFFTHALYPEKEAAVWSLGIVLYSMLNGQLPFMSDKDILTRHFMGPLPNYSGYTKDAESVIATTLAYDPFARVALEALAAHSWLRASHVPTWHELTCTLLKATDGGERRCSCADAAAAASALHAESGIVACATPLAATSAAAITHGASAAAVDTCGQATAATSSIACGESASSPRAPRAPRWTLHCRSAAAADNAAATLCASSVPNGSTAKLSRTACSVDSGNSSLASPPHEVAPLEAATMSADTCA